MSEVMNSKLQQLYMYFFHLLSYCEYSDTLPIYAKQLFDQVRKQH